VQVKACPIEFCGSSEFLRAVHASTDETFVESLLVRSIVRYQWDAYGWRVGVSLFALHVLTFSLLEILGPHGFYTKCGLVLMSFALVTAESSQIYELGWSYFRFPSFLSNLVDIMYILVLLQNLLNPDSYEGNTRALTSVFFWFRCSRYFRLHKRMGGLLTQLEEIIKDTGLSILLLSIVIFGTVHMLMSGGYLPENMFVSGGDLPENYEDFQMFFKIFDIGLFGNTIPTEFVDGSIPHNNALMKIAIYLVFVYFAHVVMMNFLIAVMGDTFERVAEQKKVLGLRSAAQTLLEVRAHIPADLIRRFSSLLSPFFFPAHEKRPFLYVCEPTARVRSEEWSGFSGEIKKKVDKVDKRLDELTGLLLDSREHFQTQLDVLRSHLDDQLDERLEKLEEITKRLCSLQVQQEPPPLPPSPAAPSSTQ
jgi:hypothetical protein